MNHTLPAVHPQSEYRFGLVGYPLGHSLSPGIHQAALRALDLEGEYRLYPIEPSPPGFQELKGLLQQVRDGLIQGLNVTIPHKRTILPLLDDLSPAAVAIGAANTIYARNSRLVGDNTDAPGFWADLGKQFNGRSFQSSRVVVLGAGGSTRAVTYVLLENDCRVMILARRVDQAQALAAQFAGHAALLTTGSLREHDLLLAAGCTLMVNTTPVGMVPHPEASPWPERVPFPEGAAVYDLVYNPRETILVRQARAAGLQAVTGFGMLVEQAALAFERWTGLEAPRQVMLESIPR